MPGVRHVKFLRGQENFESSLSLVQFLRRHRDPGISYRRGQFPPGCPGSRRDGTGHKSNKFCNLLDNKTVYHDPTVLFTNYVTKANVIRATYLFMSRSNQGASLVVQIPETQSVIISFALFCGSCSLKLLEFRKTPFPSSVELELLLPVSISSELLLFVTVCITPVQTIQGALHMMAAHFVLALYRCELLRTLDTACMLLLDLMASNCEDTMNDS